ncbi:MFS transporter [Chelatococcus reniformis]|uniref:MFS transporter n=1 Tax=Chelatococcus reniformis TaxID=1494448 RepID=A0A916X828_9HYPH|nr:MFS transporter [Chelatococcus reniformis]GGC48897.1 MFS transporter [Chelatococcus reniformis]
MSDGTSVYAGNGRMRAWWLAPPKDGEAATEGGAAASRLGQLSWALFEGGRDPYVILITIYLFGPYFSNVLVGDPVRGQALWSTINGLAGLFVAVTAPVLGAIADQGGARKPWLGVFTAVMVIAGAMLWLAAPGGQGLSLAAVSALVIVLGIMVSYTETFHNAMLPSVAGPKQLAGLSGLALAFGNFSAILLLLFILIAFTLPGQVAWSFIPSTPWLGISQAAHEPERLSGPIAAIWLVLLALPLFLFVPDRVRSGLAARDAVVRGLGGLKRTLMSLRSYRNVALYLLARMIYTDGKTATLVLSGLYAAGVFSWGPLTMLAFGIILSCFGTFGGVFGGWLDNALGSKRAILVSIGGTALGLLLTMSMTPTTILFFIPYDPASPPVHDLPFFRSWPELIYLGLTIIVAVFITAAYANSRTMLARIAPLGRMTEFFGLYALSGTATAFVGPFVVAGLTTAFHSQRAGMTGILVLLLAGFALMLGVREERAVAVD